MYVWERAMLALKLPYIEKTINKMKWQITEYERNENGVTQGIILGQLLFIIDINDIVVLLPYVRMYGNVLCKFINYIAMRKQRIKSDSVVLTMARNEVWCATRKHSGATTFCKIYQ